MHTLEQFSDFAIISGCFIRENVSLQYQTGVHSKKAVTVYFSSNIYRF